MSSGLSECKSPGSRKVIPKWEDFHCYTTHDNGVYVLRNGKHKTLFQFESQDDMLDHAQRIVSVLSELYRVLYNEYISHKKKFPEYYLKTYDEANFIHRAMMRGFNAPFFCSPYNNWFGVSPYDPEVSFAKGNKTIFLSLQGISMPFPKIQPEGFDVLQQERRVRYIRFKKGDEILYQDWFGKLPSDKFIEDFINDTD